MVSFRGNTICRVMSKSVGENSDLWEIEVQGRRGYAPKTMIMEQKILIKAADLIRVDSEPKKQSSLESKVKEDSSENITNRLLDSELYSPSEEKNNGEAVIEPVMKKIDVFKTGIKKKTNIEHFDTFKSDNSEDDIRNVPETNEEKFVPPIASKKTTKNHLLTPFANPKTSMKNDFTDIEELKHFESTPNSIIQTSTSFEKNSSSSNALNEMDFSKSIPISSKTESNNEELKKERPLLAEDTSRNNFTNVIQQKDASEIDDDFKSNEQNVPHATLPEEIAEPSQELSENGIISSTDAEEIDIHVIQDGSVDIAESLSKPSNQLENEIASITDDVQLGMGAIEQVTNEFAESLHKPSDQTEEQIISNTKDEQINNVNDFQEITNRIEEPNDNENIFLKHSDSDLSIQDNEKNWYDIPNDMLYKVSFFTQKLYKLFLYEGNENFSENCNSNTFDGERENDEACSKATTQLRVSNYLNFIYSLFIQLITIGDIKFLLFLEVFALITFIFGHYCFVRRRAENALVSKLNIIERKLFASEKDCSLAKLELLEKCKILDGIADKSFGTDDMIKQLEIDKAELNKQVFALEKELEAAAEAGLELNKMVAELLSSNQNGSDSIINSVEELQQQLNDQEATSIYINNLLAEKSRENSELKVQLSETNKKFNDKIDEIMNVNKKLCKEKEAAEGEMKNMTQVYKLNIEGKMAEISQFKKEYESLEKKYDNIFSKWQSSAAQAESFKTILSQIENSNLDIKSIQEIADANAKYLTVEKENEFLKESLSNEKELRKRLQSQIADMNSDISRLRSTANQNEKEKLEAETRLDVLSNYFKEKETQLQRYE